MFCLCSSNNQPFVLFSFCTIKLSQRSNWLTLLYLLFVPISFIFCFSSYVSTVSLFIIYCLFIASIIVYIYYQTTLSDLYSTRFKLPHTLLSFVGTQLHTISTHRAWQYLCGDLYQCCSTYSHLFPSWTVDYRQIA